MVNSPCLLIDIFIIMEKVLLAIQVIISILLTLLILIQSKDEGFTASGGGGFHITRRGPEKIIFITTIVLGVLFLVNALMFVFVK